jgi:hypothetical protein
MQDRINAEAILGDLYASAIDVEIAWLWDGGIDVRLGDPLNGYKAEGKVSSIAEAAVWLRDQTCLHYPHPMSVAVGSNSRASLAGSRPARTSATI